MNRVKPLQILVYQDVLCAWSFVAEWRVEGLRREFGDAVRWIRRPYPLRLQDVLPLPRERDHFVRELERARKEPEGKRLVPDLWTSQDPPRSSLPALAALEAAKLQGGDACTRMSHALRRAALEQGVNVSRSDVIYEIASAQGLEMNRFAAAFQSTETARLILEEHRICSERGVRGAPTFVINGRWMMSGLRDLQEYREEIAGCMQKMERRRVPGPERVLH